MTLSTATLLFAVKAAQFSTYFSWAEATSGLVFTHMCQSNPWYMPVNCRESMALSTSECLCPSFFFLGQLWRAWGSFLWCPQFPASPSQRGAEQQSCTGRVLLQVYWAAEGIQWPSQPTRLHFGTCDWFLSLYMKATILHRATAA